MLGNLPIDDEIIESDNLTRIKSIVDELGVDALLPDELAEYEALSFKTQTPDDHYANLAEFMDDSKLSHIAQEVCQWVVWDEESRREWEEREKKGIQLLGVSSKSEGGATFEGASKVTHPLLIEAITQFHSRAITELWPSEGPVKTQVLGEIDAEKTAQAQRVEDYLNYLYTTQMPGGFEEHDQMLFRLPLSGSCFKKVYYDPLEECICSRLVEPSDFIAPYSATDLRTAPRYTHRLRETHNHVLKKMLGGFYKRQTISEPINEMYNYPIVRDEIAKTEGRHRTQIAGDQRHTILEMYVDYDLDGFKEKDEKGAETGISLPYIITVDRDFQKVLRIQRNWKPDDDKKNKRIYFSHYKFTPGFGFYGYGLLHLIGGLTSSATGSLRALMDSAQFANMQGGFKTRDSKIHGGDTPIAPGEWREVDCSSEDLKNAFFPLPYKEPSETLFKLLEYLDERGQRFVGTTENMVGEANNQAPVGTTLALIEQGSKTFSAIHKRLHEAAGREYKIVHDLCFEYLPDEGYPYDKPGISNIVMATDFDGRIDVIPVSDPNIISTTQRIAQAQSVLQLAREFPAKVNLDMALKLMLETLRIPNADSYMVNQDDPMAKKAQELELEKTQAEIDKLKAETFDGNVKGLYAAAETAQVIASMPEVTPAIDELSMSSGFKDHNGYPVAGAQQITPAHQGLPPTSTDPMSPAMPDSPMVGANHGIETMANDGVM